MRAGSGWVQACSVTAMLVLAAIAAASVSASEQPLQPASVVYVRVEATIDPAASRLGATTRVTIAPGLHDTQPVRFLLNRDLALTGVTADNVAVTAAESRGFEPKQFWEEPDYEALSSYRLAREIDVTPSTAWPDTVVLEFRYAGTVYDSLRSPEVAYARSFEESQGLIDPRGLYLEGGSFWIPTLPGALFPFDVSVTLPAGWRGVSQGQLASHEDATGGSIDRWLCVSPMEEIYLAGGPLVVREREHGTRTLYTFTHAADDSLTGRYLDATARYLDLYESLYGPYPFEKFALVENFWQTGYGMPSFTLLGDQVIRLPFIIDTSYAHEILHNWWGNGVFVEATSGNWCEGLTAFGSDYRVAEGRGEGRDYRLGVLRDYLNYVRAGRDLPLTAFRERENAWSQAVGYGKSTMLFHMLRQRLGEDAFNAGLRAFYRDELFRLAGWRELLAALGRAGGADLGVFRGEWIERAGAPLLWPGSAHPAVSREGFTLLGTLRQESPAYRLDVPVRVETEEGDTTFTVSMDDTAASFTVVLATRPKALWVDPDFDLFRRLHRGEIPPTLGQTLGAESTLVVVAGGGAFSEAFGALARDWAGRGGFKIVAEGEAGDWMAPGRSVWVLGHGRLDAALAGLLPSGVIEGAEWVLDGKRYSEGNASIVLTLAHPRDPERSVSWFVAADASAVASIGRKIPHYGKYSYLVFEGSRNTAKGIWDVADSPMRLVLEAQ